MINLRYPGQYYDQETGLHYNYFRDYDPTIGQYVQSDPIGLQGGLSTYAYVGGNPLSFIDSNGLSRDKGNLGPLIGNILDKLLPPYNMQGDDDESDSIWGDGTRDHPSHDDEADALDTPLDATCEELAWAIGVLEAAIEWRKEKIRCATRRGDGMSE